MAYMDVKDAHESHTGVFVDSHCSIRQSMLYKSLINVQNITINCKMLVWKLKNLPNNESDFYVINAWVIFKLPFSSL